MIDVRWPKEVVDSYDIPDSAKYFLIETGLPSTVGTSTFEFGIYDCDDRCVIGQDFDYAIYIDLDGCVWHEPDSDDAKPIFMNSSLEALAAFLNLYLSHTGSVQEAVNNLRQIDPRAFDDHEYIWPRVWEDSRNQFE